MKHIFMFIKLYKNIWCYYRINNIYTYILKIILLTRLIILLILLILSLSIFLSNWVHHLMKLYFFFG